MASAMEAIARVECFGRESAVERIRLEDLVLAREDARLKETMAQAWYAQSKRRSCKINMGQDPSSRKPWSTSFWLWKGHHYMKSRALSGTHRTGY